MSMNRPESITVSTHGVHADERMDFWLDHVARTLVRLECSGTAADGIDAVMTSRDLDPLKICNISANRHAIVRSSHSIRVDQRDAVFVCLIKEGSGYTFQGADCMLHQPGDVVIYDTASPYGHGFPGDMSMTVLDIPRETFEMSVGKWRYQDLVKIDHGTGVTRWAVQQIGKLLGQPSSLNDRVNEQLATRILELLQSMLYLNDGGTAAGKSTLHTLLRAKAYIEEHLSDDDLDSDGVSRTMRLSPRQLSRVFELEGMPVTRYIWSRRLERCRAELRDPALRHLSVSEIAFRWGFNHSAHFSRSYRARFNETPTQTRLNALGVNAFRLGKGDI